MLAAMAPAAAMSTAQETAQGREENQQIDASSIVLHDPFLNSWVDRVGGALAQHRVRTDINYTFTVLDDPSINAFAIKGGFVHVNIGLLNFVSSDDDLAATLGHEMGHVELHHVTKGQTANAVIGILEGILSVLSVPAAVLTSIGGELVTQKYSRAQELQADHYGVSIMSKAGFDPEAAIDVMRRLGQMDPGPDARADKAFLDHPVPSDRVAHLLGYPELNHPPAIVIVARAIHDGSEGRFSYARAILVGALKRRSSADGSAYLRQLDFALRESGGLAAPDPRTERRIVTQSDPQRVSALAALKAAQATETSSLEPAKANSQLGDLELSDLVNHLQTLPVANGQSPGGPSPAPSPGASPKPESAVQMLNRDVIAIVNLTSDVFSTAPSLIGATRQPIDEMREPLSDSVPLTPKYASLLPYYPRMTQDLRGSMAQLVAALSEARSAVANLRMAVQSFNDEQRAAESEAARSNAPPPTKPRVRQVPPEIMRLLAATGAALAQASHASDEMYAAQTVVLSSELTLLDLYSSPERYAAFSRAIGYRFPGVETPAYSQIVKSALPGGDVGCAAWLSFETSKPMTDVLETMKRSRTTCATLATDNHLLPESLEIAEGLLYENYDDAPNPGP